MMCRRCLRISSRVLANRMNTTPKVTLGIDPGYDRMGYAVIVGDVGQETLLDVGCIQTEKTDTHAKRLSVIAREVRGLFDTHHPTRLAIETLFFSNNQTTALAVAEARGVVLAIAGAFTVEVIELGPGQVKQSVTGNGAADKQQVQEMIKRILHLKEIPKPDDAADAAAIAWAGLVG